MTEGRPRVQVHRLVVPSETKRNRAMRGGDVLQGAATGGVGGAVAGKYLGGSRGAAIGGAAGSALGAIRGGLKATERQAGDAMREERRIVREAVREAKKMKKTSSDFLSAMVDGPGLELEDLRALPMPVEEKLSYFSGLDSCFLEKFEGSPLYTQAVALEEEDLTRRMQSLLARQESDKASEGEQLAGDLIKAKKTQLELELHKLRAAGSVKTAAEKEPRRPGAGTGALAGAAAAAAGLIGAGTGARTGASTMSKQLRRVSAAKAKFNRLTARSFDRIKNMPDGPAKELARARLYNKDQRLEKLTRTYNTLKRKRDRAENVGGITGGALGAVGGGAGVGAASKALAKRRDKKDATKTAGFLPTKTANCPPNPVGGIDGTPTDPEWPEAALGTGAGSQPSAKDILRQNDKARPQEVAPKTSSYMVMLPIPVTRLSPGDRAEADAVLERMDPEERKKIFASPRASAAMTLLGGVGGSAIGAELASGRGKPKTLGGALLGAAVGAGLGYGTTKLREHLLARGHLRTDGDRSKVLQHVHRTALGDADKTAALTVPRGIQRMAARQRAADAASAGRKGIDRVFDTAGYKAQQAKEHAARVAAKHKEQAEGGFFRSPATRRLVEATKLAALIRLRYR